MLKRSLTSLTTLALAAGITAQTALAQRPPSGNQGPPQMSLERIWGWLVARPGVIIAILVIAAAIIYMVATRGKSRT